MSSSDLHVTRLGDHGPPVAFCHGLFGQGKNWGRIGQDLAADHRVMLIDLPHHGASPWSDRFDLLEVADQVATLFPAEEPVTLVGHSLGGKAAMVLALRHPQLVERLCVVDVSPVPYQHAQEFAGYIAAMQAIDLAGLTQRRDAHEALARTVPDTTVRTFLLQNLRREGESWRWQVNLDVLGRDLAEISGWPQERLEGLPPFAGPVLWMAGERSPYVREEYVAAMDRWFPANRRVTIKDAGHWVHAEQPGVFVEVLRRFLA